MLLLGGDLASANTGTRGKAIVTQRDRLSRVGTSPSARVRGLAGPLGISDGFAPSK